MQVLGSAACIPNYAKRKSTRPSENNFSDGLSSLTGINTLLSIKLLFPNMKARKTYLIGIAFFTGLFMALMLLGSYLLSIESKQFAVASFLFAFGAVFGQIACLALYIRQKAMLQTIAAQRAQEYKNAE